MVGERKGRVNRKNKLKQRNRRVDMDHGVQEKVEKKIEKKTKEKNYNNIDNNNHFGKEIPPK